LIEINDRKPPMRETTGMKSKLATLTAGTCVLAAISHVYGQYTPPPPPAPFQGFINEALRKDDPT
jgi:hypothetical protein